MKIPSERTSIEYTQLGGKNSNWKLIPENINNGGGKASVSFSKQSQATTGLVCIMIAYCSHKDHHLASRSTCMFCLFTGFFISLSLPPHPTANDLKQESLTQRNKHFQRKERPEPQQLMFVCAFPHHFMGIRIMFDSVLVVCLLLCQAKSFLVGHLYVSVLTFLFLFIVLTESLLVLSLL